MLLCLGCRPAGLDAARSRLRPRAIRPAAAGILEILRILIAAGFVEAHAF
jgi:hypothetical protein